MAEPGGTHMGARQFRRSKTPIPKEPLMPDLAQAIIDLINSKPRSPTKAEIEAVLAAHAPQEEESHLGDFIGDDSGVLSMASANFMPQFGGYLAIELSRRVEEKRRAGQEGDPHNPTPSNRCGARRR